MTDLLLTVRLTDLGEIDPELLRADVEAKLRELVVGEIPTAGVEVIADLHSALHALQEVIAGQDESFVVQLVQARIAADPALAGITQVTFHTDEWDNGWFYNEHDTMVVQNGQTSKWWGAFSDDSVAYRGNDLMHEALTELSSDYGALTASSTLTVDVVTGTVEAT